jgi:hypothetical protein
MSWYYLVVAIIIAVVAYVMRPKPPGQPPPSLSELNIPTAEPGREIPKVYGSRRIKSPNIVWYGDLGYLPVKKKGVTIGYLYYLGMHMILGYPVEEVTGIYADDIEVWKGSITENTRLNIQQHNLFGGPEKEGGIVGEVDVELGGPTQQQNSYLKSTMGEGQDIPAFRGVTGIVLRHCYVTAMTKYPKPWSISVKNIPRGWYPEKAEIVGQGVEGDDDYIPGGSCNPAHIIYDIMTDSEIGMGLNPLRINEASFIAAADTLYDENFGLSLILNKQSQVKDFVQTIISHINATLYEEKTSNQWVIKLIREPSQAELDAAAVFDETNIVKMVDFERPSFAEMINEVVIKYRPQFSSKDNSLPVQDMASIKNQYGIISQTSYYSGIDNATIARRVGLRDVKQYATPLAKGKFNCNRSGASIRPGDIIKLSWDDYGIEQFICRVFAVNSGSINSGQVTITYTQDIFTLPLTTYIENQPPIWVNPIGDPVAVENQIFTEMTYYDLIKNLSIGDLNALNSNISYVQLFPQKPGNIASADYEYWLSTGTYQQFENGDYSPTAQLTNPIGKMDTVIDVDSISADASVIPVGSYAAIGNEIVIVDGIDTANSQITVSRGTIDTLPQDHLAGDILYFGETFAGRDLNPYASGTNISAKALVATTSVLDIDDALESSLTTDARQFKPYPPSNIQINALYYPSGVTGDIDVTWAHRDRTAPNLIGFLAGDVGPEAGTQYEITITDLDGPTIIKTETLSTTQLTYTEADELLDHGQLATNVRVELKSLRGGVDSLQTFSHDFTRTPS